MEYVIASAILGIFLLCVIVEMQDPFDPFDVWNDGDDDDSDQEPK